VLGSGFEVDAGAGDPALGAWDPPGDPSATRGDPKTV